MAAYTRKATVSVLSRDQARLLARVQDELSRWDWTVDSLTYTHFDYVAAARRAPLMSPGGILHVDHGTIRARILPDGADGPRAFLRCRRERRSPHDWSFYVSQASFGAAYANRGAWYAPTLNAACKRLAEEYDVYASLL
jgi:hypothetical protein